MDRVAWGCIIVLDYAGFNDCIGWERPEDSGFSPSRVNSKYFGSSGKCPERRRISAID